MVGKHEIRTNGNRVAQKSPQHIPGDTLHKYIPYHHKESVLAVRHAVPAGSVKIPFRDRSTNYVEDYFTGGRTTPGQAFVRTGWKLTKKRITMEGKE